jgi:hypothetical protein
LKNTDSTQGQQQPAGGRLNVAARPPQRVAGLLAPEAGARWERLELERGLARMADVVHCPRCSAPCIEDADNCAQCPACLFAFCTLCNDAWHARSVQARAAGPAPAPRARRGVPLAGGKPGAARELGFEAGVQCGPEFVLMRLLALGCGVAPAAGGGVPAAPRLVSLVAYSVRGPAAPALGARPLTGVPGAQCVSAELRLEVLRQRMGGVKDPALLARLRQREQECLSLARIKARAGSLSTYPTLTLILP